MNNIKPPPPPFKIGQRIVPANIEDLCEEYRCHLRTQQYELRVIIQLVGLLEEAKIFEVAGVFFTGFNLDNPFALAEELSGANYQIQLLIRFDDEENKHAFVTSMTFPSCLFKAEPQQYTCKVCGWQVPEDRDCKCFCSNMCADRAMYDSISGPMCTCD